MTDSQLMTLIAGFEKLENELNDRRMLVWDELVRVAPDVASEVLQFFGSKHVAMKWVTTSSPSGELSPAKQISQGDAVEVLARLRRAAHGIAT